MGQPAAHDMNDRQGSSDHLIGAHQQRLRDRQAQRLGGLQVDH
jgi:hypothetical protein